MKLGKLPKRTDRRTLQFAKYVDPAAPDRVPLFREWSPAVESWRLYRNDELGCCVLSSLGHIIQSFSANDSIERQVSDAAIEQAYRDVGGWVPGDPSTDNGAYMIDGVRYFKRVGIGGYRCEAFVEVDTSNPLHVKLAVEWFGGLWVGLQLPTSAKSERVWSSTSSAAGGWGGHAVSCVSFSPSTLTCVTWGRKQLMTPEFLARYGDEAYAILAPEIWTGDDDEAPNGLKLDELRRDLERVTA